MTDYPSNSKRVGPQIEGPKEEARRVDPVTMGGVHRRKASKGRRLSQNLFGSDVQSVWGYIIGEVLIPGTRNVIADVITGGVERALFGDSTIGTRRRSRGDGPINYAGMSGSRTMRNDPRNTNRDRSRRASNVVDDILFDQRVDALEVLDKLEYYLDKYRVVTVADLYALIREPSTHMDQKWGWYDTNGFQIRHTNGGYLLMVPPAESLD